MIDDQLWGGGEGRFLWTETKHKNQRESCVPKLSKNYELFKSAPRNVFLARN